MARVGCRTHQLQRSFRKLVEHWPGGELQHCRYHVDEQVECADTVLVREERQRAGLLVTGGPDHHDHVCANGGCQRETEQKEGGGSGIGRTIVDDHEDRLVDEHLLFIGIVTSGPVHSVSGRPQPAGPWFLFRYRRFRSTLIPPFCF